MRSMNIPIELLVFALSKRKVNQVRLYLYLKSQCSGYLPWNQETIEKIKRNLSIKETRTIHNNLEWLVKNSWVIMNSKRGVIRVVSYLVLSKKLQFHSATGALFDTSQFHNFRPFIYAAVLTYYLKYRHRIARQSERKKGRSITNCSFHEMPAQYLASILKLGKSTTTRYRQKAWDAGFIKMKHRYKPLYIPLDELEFCRIYGDEEAWQLVIHNNQVMVQLSNAITSYVRLRTKPALKKCICSREKVDPL
ncbi:hypothetical protein BXY64_1181 [Marinifilum flexuosum]|uniref:Uncharacterized protein n=2 Tax=Marinifilum flexuosum TaxID=1117708 RepID=A0A419X947_9BACT|nr:hypothetical protein BXY64_1181 [Marinifilum flexuosum]